MKYIKLFGTHSEYEAYIQDRQNLVLPNVSFCEDTPNEVHYNPYEEPDTRLIATFSGGGSKQLYGYEHFDFNVDGATLFNSIEIDGTDVSIQELDNNEGKYTFSSGEHVVKYVLKDPTKITSGMFILSDPHTVMIPNTVEEIEGDVFMNARNLSSVTIPSSVTSIGYGILEGRSNLSLIVEAVTPPSLAESLGYTSNLIIYVPSESVDTYKAAENWSNYASIIQAIQ